MHALKPLLPWRHIKKQCIIYNGLSSVSRRARWRAIPHAVFEVWFLQLRLFRIVPIKRQFHTCARAHTHTQTNAELLTGTIVRALNFIKLLFSAQTLVLRSFFAIPIRSTICRIAFDHMFATMSPRPPVSTRIHCAFNAMSSFSLNADK